MKKPISKLTAIQGGGVRSELVSCPKCGGVSFIETRHTMRRMGGYTTGGARGLACARCMAEGRLVEVTGL